MAKCRKPTLQQHPAHASCDKRKHAGRDSATVTCRAATVTCKDATDLIGDYLSDNLNSEKRRAFEAHLSGCRDCAAFLATYKRTIGLTKSFIALQSLQPAPVNFKLRRPSAG